GPVRLHLGYNPSHLEAVNSIILGMTRALQRKNKDTQDRKSVIPLLIHGDAAFCGQGSVSETLQLSHLKGYTTGGAIHIILNNQLGFTTSPREGRSTPYASDLAKSIQAPVLFVNADDVEAGMRAIDRAIRFRQEFGRDVFIDLIGYRRHGHNEGDEPSFTQPAIYEKIKNHPTAAALYQSRLIEEKSLTEEKAGQIKDKHQNNYETALAELPAASLKKKDWLGLREQIPKVSFLKTTGTTKEKLKKILEVVSSEPADFALHPKVKRILKKRRERIGDDQLDWALCELAAYGALLQDCFSIRLSGQDSKRGTFSHRHSIYYDKETGEEYSPLKKNLASKGVECCLYNSPLSEMAVLGFEYGNSCMAPDFLTIWEAQFGDFVNGAQVIVDNFISSGEQKWLQATDIVLFLPHGYEGQGPEHSSGMLERFLQLCAQGNMQVCNLTTPANLFHVLRRQKTLKNRKPLILMTPKSLLRHQDMTARAEELCNGRFNEVIWDSEIGDSRDIESVVLCSGKVYYDLKAARLKDPSKNSKSAVFRVEQLYPFPETQLNPILNGFPCLKKIVWLQEEPANRGAWFYIKPQLENTLRNIGQNPEIQYIGRTELAAAAGGSFAVHVKEQEELMAACQFAL
ncbi:MAG: 2-oxoglutarate dehydrogenase E1 component, partial [Bdellovibrionales bacterium]|nr:2-oxoglutarate dehydrogenase E1 component [Bdellovibrionales bacterium]